MAVNPPIPALPTDEDTDVLGWALEVLQESDAFLRAQPGYDPITESMETVNGSQAEGPLGRMSRTRSNRIGKIASDLAALLTDIKPFWEYKSGNPKFEKHNEILGKLATTWYFNRQVDMRFGDMIRYWTVGGTSYAHLKYNPDIEDCDVEAEDPRDVLPIRPSGYESLQSAQGVIVRRERTVNYVKQLFPEKAHLIKPDRDGSVTVQGGGATGALMRATGMTPFQQRLWGNEPQRQMPKIPVVDLYTMYVRDDRRNESDNEVAIGQFDNDGKPMNNWSYIVKPGEQLYPRKRCIQFTKTCVLYNSTSIYWHGKYPLPKLTLDPWPNTWLGKAPIHDLLPLGLQYDRTLRAMADLLEKFVQPDVIADKNSISRAALNAINTRAAGQKFLQNGLVGKGMTLQYPQMAAFDLASRLIDILRDELDTISGVRDMSQLMRLNQLPGADTLEKLTESMSPSVRGRSRAMEAFVREFAEMLAYNFAQFWTMPMRLMALGPQGITPEDFDTDPGSFIPQFVHAGDYERNGSLKREALDRGPLPRYDRAKEFMKQFTFHVAPGSLLASSEIERKLMYLQLSRAGLIDHWTLLEVLGIPNVGEPPNGANTISDRLVAEQLIGLGMQASAAGRKATGQTMPRMVTKES